MELRHLRYFIAVAEERNFGRAARKLRIAQPPLSRQIQAFERELGFALFDRSRRQVELTTGGQALLSHARRVLEILDLAVRDARRASNGEIGRIAIGYPSSLAYSGLTELMRAFHDRYPSVAVTLRELPPQPQLDALRDGTLDVGFVRAIEDDPRIVCEQVRREPLVVALPSNHPLATRERLALSTLAREPFIAFPRARGPGFFDQIMRLCHDAGFTPRIVQEAPQLDIVSLVAAGFGVAIVPASVREVRREGLVFRSIVGKPTTDLFVASRANDPSPVVRDFLSLVRTIGIKRRRLR